MITNGYTLNLVCDCIKCKNSPYTSQIATGEFVGETYSECARKAKKEGWGLAKDRVYCSAPNHSAAVED